MPRDPKDLGILFRGDMVRAILAGEKRVTRRAIKNPHGWHLANPAGWSIGCYHKAPPHFYTGSDIECRYTPGRRLWVRETWRSVGWRPENGNWIEYRADRAKVWREAPEDVLSVDVYDHANPDPKWRPSLLMPRWASRITLRVTDVRADRLTEITAEDVALEGLVHAGLGATPADYRRLYRGMHGLPDDADPWVWRIAFEVIDAR